jgi:hypothetical protein
MIINIINKKINKATYGLNNCLIDVTYIIKQHINISITIDNILFKKDPIIGEKKQLIIYYNDETKDVIPENTNIFLNNNEVKDNVEMKNNITFGFIIIRYVINKKTDNFWIQCYRSIRKFYDNKIVIIDDNSNQKFITQIPLKNTVIVQSKYPKRGEFLPYYYYYHNKYFDRAIVFHDGIIVKKYFDYNNIANFNGYSKLFYFENMYYKMDLDYIVVFCNNIKKGNTILNYHNQNINKLKGCFGIMYAIDHDFLVKVQEEYNFLNLINIIDTRKKRQTLERFSAVLFEKYCIDNNIKTSESILGKFPDIINNTNMFVHKKLCGR